jgi:hypothetical protein
MKNLTVLNKNKRRPAVKNIYEKRIREQREDHNKTQAQIAAFPGSHKRCTLAMLAKPTSYPFDISLPFALNYPRQR